MKTKLAFHNDKVSKNFRYFVSGLTNGGPAGLVWSFLITWVGVFSVICCLGELSSMYVIFHY